MTDSVLTKLAAYCANQTFSIITEGVIFCFLFLSFPDDANWLAAQIYLASDGVSPPP